MQNRDEAKDFLTSRRAKVSPEQVELPGGTNRRVPGLRRTDVAMLAGVSVEYYAKLERGNLVGASESVLTAIADALLLDDAERAHLFDLARAASASPIRRSSRTPAADRQTGHAVGARRLHGPAPRSSGTADSTSLAENQLFEAVYWDLYALSGAPGEPRLASPTSTETCRRRSTGTGPRRPTSTSGSSGPRPGGTRTTRALQDLIRRTLHEQRRVPDPLWCPRRPAPSER